MSIKTSRKSQPEIARPHDAESEGQDTANKVREQVSKIVGTAPELVVVRPLWFRRFRVNVLRPDAERSGRPGGLSIGQSYFIVTNDQGEIVKSHPPLKAPNQPLRTP